MLACVDVDYRGDEGPAVASCVVWEGWDSHDIHEERAAATPRVSPYTPGRLYERELPCLLRVLSEVEAPLEAILVDGHVWLDDRGRPGLGAYLYDALEKKIPVIGIAKNPFGGFRGERCVLRGQSQRPLFITAVGIDVDVAAEGVRRMHGAHRVPSLLTRADQLCRGMKRGPASTLSLFAWAAPRMRGAR
jgi:deoxyribonuclease V